MNSENKSETPHTNSIRLVIAAGDWRNESDCTKCALDELEKMERELNEAKVTIAVLSPSAVGNNLRVQSLEQELSQLRSDLKNAQDAIASARDAALVEACKLIQKRADDYDAENGWTDMETGTREYPKGGDDYMLELTEIQELIATLRTQPAKERTEK